MKLAVCRWSPDVTGEAIELLCNQGVDIIEAPPSFLLDFDDTGVQTNTERLTAAGIRINVCHGPFSHDDDISVIDPSARAAALERQLLALRRAALTGAHCMVVHPSGPVDASELDARTDNLRAGLEAMLEVAEQTGVKLALENMLPKHLCSRVADIRGFLDEFDTPLLSVCFDVGHANVGPENIQQAITALEDRIIAFHLHDNDGTRDIHVQPPYGSIDWPALVAKLLSLEFPHPFSIECDPWNQAPLSVLLREVRSIFAGEMPAETRFNDVTVWSLCPQCRHYFFPSDQGAICACK
ncbi:MAG: sugar phosphate isomerase/epimerase family protein [Phycisphaerae bacterium]|jgi:sugar phosphate isomerase/epimerase|nr:sugar phosphate isomerase/epimerase family protein [Phycisphaerae bacterium]